MLKNRGLPILEVVDLTLKTLEITKPDVLHNAMIKPVDSWESSKSLDLLTTIPTGEA